MPRLSVFFVAVLWIGLYSQASATAITPQPDYFVNAFAGSPLAYYLAGDVGNSTSAVETSSTYYTDGTNVFSSSGDSSVDLSIGTLHSSASADYGYNPGGLPNDPTDQFGNSSFGDGLTFVGNFTGQTATFNISVDGTWTGDTPAFNGSDFQFMVLPTGTINANSGNTLNIFNNPGNVAIVNDTNPLSATSPDLTVQRQRAPQRLQPDDRIRRQSQHQPVLIPWPELQRRLQRHSHHLAPGAAWRNSNLVLGCLPGYGPRTVKFRARRHRRRARGIGLQAQASRRG